MKTQVFLLFAVLFSVKVSAQRCYHCASITTNGEGLNLPSTETGFSSCDGGSLDTADCSVEGGCLKAEFSFLYDVQGSGRVRAGVVLRTCGAASDYCLSDNLLDQVVNRQRDSINSMLPSGVTFVSGTGDACTCTGNLCNSSPVLKVSFAVLLVSLLLSYVTTKW